MSAQPFFLGIELGSTRIKAVLIDEDHRPAAAGDFTWENRLADGVWTYGLDEVWNGLQAAYRALAADFKSKRGGELEALSGIGVSAMMHGYLPFDRDGNQLVPFRTWRNTTTGKAAAELTERFGFNIPLRWSIAHLYQAILNHEPHVKDIDFLTTLAGYVHWKLTGQKVLGVGDASGMFPINSETGGYDAAMLDQFNALTGLDAARLLPAVLAAGQDAGALTDEGAKLLDPSGRLKAGIPFCPPEGDAGTGMTATNSVAARTGNVSAGTSIFAMIVLEKALARVYPEIDLVTTPEGKPVAMVHCNNCTSDIDAWARLFGEALGGFGVKPDKSALYDFLYNASLEAEDDCGGLLSYNYCSGEPVTGFEEGRPLLIRAPDSRLTLANFFRSLLFSAAASLKIGMDILEREHVAIDRIAGHGGLFKTKGVGQKLLAAALKTPVTISESAGEGGAWGIAVLAAYRAKRNPGENLDEYLTNKVFAGNSGESMPPDEKDIAVFAAYMERYKAGLAIEQAAVEHFLY